MVIFVMAFFLLFVTGGLIFSQMELKKASNVKLATQVVETADAGLQHALAHSVIRWGWDFNTQLNSGTPSGTVIAQTAFPAGSAFSYTVTARNDSDGGGSTSDTNKIIVLTSTATGPNGSKKVVEAYVKRSLVSFVSPGALYFPAGTDPLPTITFDAGTSFFITGNDTGYDGLPAANPKPAILGVATINDTVRNRFKTALGSSRYNLVQGYGYSAGPPIAPSVITTDNVFDVDQIARNFYNQVSSATTCPPKCLDGLVTSASQCPSTSPCTLGTDASPQITYIRESSSHHIHLDGYVSGSGVLVLEGKTHLYGNFNFHGLVVMVNLGVTAVGAGNPTDDAESFSLRNNAKVYGTVIRGSTNGAQAFDMRNSAKIYYSSQAVTVVNNLCGSCLAQPVRVFAWLDK